MSIIHLLYCNPFFSIIKVMPTSDINSQSPVASTETRTLLDILLSSKLITKEQYDDVKVKSASQGVSQETVIKNLNLVSEQKLTEIKAMMLGVPFISLESTSFAPQALSLIPRAVVE